MSIRTRERDVESYLVDRMNALGLPCLKFIPDGKVGMPDRLILLPGQRVIWVELKTRGGHLEEIQKLQHKRLEQIGHRVVVVWNKDAVDDLVREIKNPGSYESE